MKFIWLLLFISIMPWWLTAQVIHVLDQQTLQPVAQVNIFQVDPPVSITTNDQGMADISRFKTTLEIIFSHVGYHTLRLSYAQIAAYKFTIYLEEKSFMVDEVIVSASRFAEKKSDVPMKVEVLTRKELELLNQPTMADVLQASGEIMVQKSQLGGGSPIIRGFEANKVLIVVDGVRMNNAIYRGGHLQNILTLDQAAMERVEIVFGPGSVVYGSDALGGVMHLRTKNPMLSGVAGESRYALNGYLRYGTAAKEKTAHLDFNLGGNKWGSFTSLSLADFDHLRMGRQQPARYAGLGLRSWLVETKSGVDKIVNQVDHYVQAPSAYTQYDFLQKVSYRPNPRVMHGLNIQYSTSSCIPRYDRLTLGSATAPRFAEWYYGPQDRLMAAYHLQLTPDRRWFDQAAITASAQRIVESRHDRRFNNPNLNNREETVEVAALNADFEKRLHRHEWRYGLEMNRNRVTSRAHVSDLLTGIHADLDTRYPDGGSTMHTLAAYFTHTWEITDRWIVTDGFRINSVGLQAKFIDKQFFPFPFDEVAQNHVALNGSLGVVYKPGGQWQISMQGSSGFRAPNVDDLSKIFESTPGLVIVPNPDLKPERTYNVDFGLQKKFSEHTLVTVNGYYTFYQQAITTRPFTFRGQSTITYDGQLSQVVANVNAQEAYLYGFSANLMVELLKNLTLESAFSYTFGRIRTDSTDYPLDHIPPAFGKTSLRWSKNTWRPEVYALYHGWKRLKDYNVFGEDNVAYATAQGMPAWYTLNVRISKNLHKHLQIQLAAENLLDRNYRVFASNISAPGRNFIFTLRVNY